jgi:ATP-dependent helicase/nuclease subunit B
MAEDLELALFEEDRRVFLGWETPFLSVLVDWLWPSREKFSGMLVVVPTAQSGRRLREALAQAGGCFAPKVVTPGFFLRSESAAPESIELLAWVEVLEGVRDWSLYATAFPLVPGQDEAPGWALGLARSLAGVRTSLQENALTISSAAKRLSETVEGERWHDLAALEKQVEALLREWGYTSRSAELARGRVIVPEGVEKIVVAGVSDLPKAVERLLQNASVPVSVLVSGKASDAFDGWGRPEPVWSERAIPWPEKGSVALVADPSQQAEEALRLVAEGGLASDQIALGSADEETAGELERVFGRAGWPVFNPGRRAVPLLAGWLGAWKNFLRHPGVAEAIDLISCSQSGILVRGKRAQRIVALSQARDGALVRTREDLVRAMAQTEIERAKAEAASEESALKRSEILLDHLALALESLELLESRRGMFLGEGFHRSMERLLGAIDPEGQSEAWDWLTMTGGVAEQVNRDAVFWLDLLLASSGATAAAIPEERVLDVSGWVELLYEPGQHLVVCGMNEGMVPTQDSSDPWLPEGARRVLGLETSEDRAARDAYLLSALLAARQSEGHADLLLAKSSVGGDSLTPSRLLLAADGEELARRVGFLFREIEPPESGLAWTLDDAWRWRPAEKAPRTRLSVTAFSTYLACPFRFYLKHVLHMSAPEPERVEWNARDFGNVAHLVLERWALDEVARDYSKTEAIEDWVHAELDRIIADRFGKSPPLAVRIQSEAMRQRLSWFARVQACERAAGWQVVEVEKKFSLDLGGVEVRGQVDRVERHTDGRRRILDYKTSGEAKAVEGEHRKGINAGTRWPKHLEKVEEVRTLDGKKRWTNLQVAFYSAALGDVDEIGYFALGATEADVKLSLWEGFSKADEDSAMACARWVAGQVQSGVFWPPAERSEYDDYKVLGLGRALEEIVNRESANMESGFATRLEELGNTSGATQ